MELVVVIIIVGIMAGMAVPAYRNTVEQGRGNEAKVNLNIIHMGEKVYFLNNGSFWGPGGTNITAANTALSTDMSANYYQTINVSGGGTASYSARLTRSGGGTKWFQYDYTNGNAAPAPTEGGTY
jgi:Tfp pilus assembly protein PilE